MESAFVRRLEAEVLTVGLSTAASPVAALTVAAQRAVLSEVAEPEESFAADSAALSADCSEWGVG